MTLRAIRILKEVDLIAAEDTRHTRGLLAHFDIHTPLTSFFKGNENEKVDAIIAQIISGKDVALVSDGGTPCISDPGYPLMRRAVEEGVAIVPIPGVSAVAASLSASGIPTDRFTFVGFLPDKPGKRQKAIERLRDIDHTVVLYVSPWKVEKTLKELIDILGDRPSCLCREMTKMHEEFVRGSLSEILSNFESKSARGEMVLVIGSP